VHGPATVVTESVPAIARVLRCLPGGTLTGPGYLSPRVVTGLGTVAGEVSRALHYFTHPGLDRVLQWDLRHADRVVGRLAGHVRDASLCGRIADAAGQAWQRVLPLAGHLPRQAIHGDVTDDNVVCTGRTPDGVIDFGDSTIS
jgi:Ser/Thr protein kinase RdoA (MazF antagonist)